MVKKYDSKKDLWLVIVLWLVIITMLLSMFVSFKTMSCRPAEIFVIGVETCGGILILWVLFGTFYRLDDTTLFIRSGPFSWRIERDQIREVKPSNSGISSPALSLDRVMIIYGDRNRKILVSPQSKDDFIAEIQSQLGPSNRPGS